VAELAFIVSVAFAHAMTNLDNFAVLMILAGAVGLSRCLCIFVVVQSLCLVIAGFVGESATNFLGPWVGYIGFVPITMGAMALWLRRQSQNDNPTEIPTSLSALTLLFFGLSFDTVAMISTIVGDSSADWKAYVYLGSVLSIFALVVLLIAYSKIGKSSRFVEKASTLAPYIMIAVGLYVLGDTLTDTI